MDSFHQWGHQFQLQSPLGVLDGSGLAEFQIVEEFHDLLKFAELFEQVADEFARAGGNKE